jgi:hypothetical protein
MKKRSLATAITLTLGLSVFGGVTSTFAMTETGNSIASQPIQIKKEKLYPFNVANATNPQDFGVDKTAAKAWGEKHYKKWIDDLKKDDKESKESKEKRKQEREAIYNYSGNDYTKINKYLRDGKKPVDKDLENEITYIDRALAKVTTPEAINVYRRVSEDALVDKNKKIWGKDSLRFDKEKDKEQLKLDQEKVKKFKEAFNNTTQSDKAYMSTSLVNQTTGNFPKMPILIHLTIPKGKHAAYLGSLAKLPETELLIAHGPSYKINSIEEKVDSKRREYLQIEATLN